MKKSLKKVLTIIVIITLIFAFNFPFPVSKTFNALEIKLTDNKYSVNRQVTMTGKYHLNFFDSDVFSGKITISGYEQTSNGDKMSNCNIQKQNGEIIFFNQRDSNNILVGSTTFGWIFSKKFLQDFVIVVGNSYATNDATCIVIGVDSIDLAIKKADHALNKEDW